MELKPRDYYGHQLLAQTILRGARLWGSELVSISETEKAVKAAEQARALRPESTSLLPVLIAAYSLRWEVAPTDRDVLSNKIETILGLAKRFRTSGVAIDQARIQWYVVGLRNSVDQSKFDANKELLVKLLAGLKGSIEQLAPSSWERQQVEERLKGFEDVLKTTTFADRRALAWPA